MHSICADFFFQIVSEKRRRKTYNGLMLQESSFSCPISDNRVRGKVLNQSFLLVPQFCAFKSDPLKTERYCDNALLYLLYSPCFSSTCEARPLASLSVLLQMGHQTLGQIGSGHLHYMYF